MGLRKMSIRRKAKTKPPKARPRQVKPHPSILSPLPYGRGSDLSFACALASDQSAIGNWKSPPFDIPHSSFIIRLVPRYDTRKKTVLAKQTHLTAMIHKPKQERLSPLSPLDRASDLDWLQPRRLGCGLLDSSIGGGVALSCEGLTMCATTL